MNIPFIILIALALISLGITLKSWGEKSTTGWASVISWIIQIVLIIWAVKIGGF